MTPNPSAARVDSTSSAGPGASDRAPRRLRADSQRNIDSLLLAAKTVFSTSGVDAPAKEIADKAGVGVGTLYRHFPQRSDLVKAVLRARDRCLRRRGTSPISLAQARSSAHQLAAAVHRVRGNETRARCRPALWRSGLRRTARLLLATVRPALAPLLEAATASGEVRADVSPKDLLYAIASLCVPMGDDGARTANGWSGSSSTVCAAAPRRANLANVLGPRRRDRRPALPERGAMNEPSSELTLDLYDTEVAAASLRGHRRGRPAAQPARGHLCGSRDRDAWPRLG